MTLKPVLIKAEHRSFQEVNKGDHLEMKSQHYLVESVDNDHEQLVAFTTTINKFINRVIVKKSDFKQAKNRVFQINYDHYSAIADVELSIEKARIKMSMNSKWKRSDHFVTEMKCGTAYSIDDRCYIRDDVDMVGTTKVTPHTTVDIGDHLIIKDPMEDKFCSVLVCNIVNQENIAVFPLIG